MCAFEGDLGNNGACTLPASVPTAVPTAVRTSLSAVIGDTVALMVLIGALQSDVSVQKSTVVTMPWSDSDVQSTVTAMQSVDSAMVK